MLSSIGNVDMMLGNFPWNSFERQEDEEDFEINQQSDRLRRDTSRIGSNFRSLVNTNDRDISEITAETS